MENTDQIEEAASPEETLPSPRPSSTTSESKLEDNTSDKDWVYFCYKFWNSTNFNRKCRLDLFEICFSILPYSQKSNLVTSILVAFIRLNEQM